MHRKSVCAVPIDEFPPFFMQIPNPQAHHTCIDRYVYNYVNIDMPLPVWVLEWRHGATTPPSERRLGCASTTAGLVVSVYKAAGVLWWVS